MSPVKKTTSAALLALMGVGLLSACSANENVGYDYPERRKGEHAPTWGERPNNSIFGEGGLQLFGGKKAEGEQGGGAGGIGVNSFLWRASLDTVGFMPLASADPFGGVIITDWYSPPESPAERFKLNILIMDRQLRADGVKVSTFRQLRDPAGAWRDVPVEPKTSAEMENTILTRARELRAQSAEAGK